MGLNQEIGLVVISSAGVQVQTRTLGPVQLAKRTVSPAEAIPPNHRGGKMVNWRANWREQIEAPKIRI